MKGNEGTELRRKAQGTAGPGAAVAYVNGEFVPEAEAKISIFDRSILYGDGVFDTLFARNGYIFKLDAHLQRLLRSVRAAKLELPVASGELRRLIVETVRRNGLRDAYIKCILSRGLGPAPLLDPRGCKPTLLIFAKPYLSLADPEKAHSGIRVKITSVRRVPHECIDPKIKSLNYLNIVLAKMEALDSGCDDAMMLDMAGYVCEAPGYNVFAVRGGRVLTPGQSILEGITRETVLELCAELGIPCGEANLTSYDIYTADEVFYTSTAGGIIPVVNVDDRAVGDGTPGPVWRRITGAYEKMLARGVHGTPIVEGKARKS